MQKSKKIAGLCIAVLVALFVAYTPLEEALASHNGEPTMFVNGINAFSTHSYIYNVPVTATDLAVSLQIKNLEEKSNVRLTAIDSTGTVFTCPYTPVGFNLLVAECSISAPIPGIWTFTITSGAITSGPEPVGYSIAADTLEIDHVDTEAAQP